MSQHNNLVHFLSPNRTTSKFTASVGRGGGYITFTNTGRPEKAFTLSLESILTGLSDIEKNLSAFSSHSKYDEKKWRDLGGTYFSDLALKSISTVQTKPLFTTISKIISWANEKPYNDDNHVDLTSQSLRTTKAKLTSLIEEYLPKQINFDAVKNREALGSFSVLQEKLIRDFARKVFTYFYNPNWDKVIEKSITRHSSMNNINFTSYDFEPFTKLIASFDEPQNRENLTSSNTLRFFENPIFHNGERYFYFSNQWNGTNDRNLSFDKLKAFFEEKFPRCQIKKLLNTFSC